MSRPRVYIQAVGMINALGNDLTVIAQRAGAGESPGMNARPMRTGEHIVGQIEQLDAWADGPPLDEALRAYDCRNNRLFLATLKSIRQELDRTIERYGRHRIGVVLGTSTSGIGAGERALQILKQTGVRPSDFDYRQMEIGTLAPFAALVLGVTGPAYTVSTACTSSAKAILAARRLLRLGICDAVLTGGVDTLCELTMQGFASLQSISSTRTNPMSRNRCGINIGEGGALILLTRDEAEVELVGGGESSDAYHVSSPDPEGVGGELALREALSDAGIDAGQVGYVNLHATATPKNDEMESRLMARVFPAGVACSGSKPLTGHMLGTAAAGELGLAWLTLTQGNFRMPLHVWDGDPDPELPPLDLVTSPRALEGTVGSRYVMSNSFAFGGSNATLILRG